MAVKEEVHLVIPDTHAHYKHNNKRAEYLGHLINDLRPTKVIMIGDMADMPSLSSYDKGRKSFIGRTYKQDINSHLDFQDRMWSIVKKSKKKLPLRIALIGNHEQRIDRAIDIQPELEGVISYDDLQLDSFYDCVVPYNGSTPGHIEVDGVTYAHYMVSGISGRPISGEHHAYSLLAKNHASCTVGHSHTLDFAVRTLPSGGKIMGLVCGVYQEHFSEYAGESNRLWHPGVVIKRGVEEGRYDPEFVSLKRLKKLYSGAKSSATLTHGGRRV